jgi:hypothetical protein
MFLYCSSLNVTTKSKKGQPLRPALEKRGSKSRRYSPTSWCYQVWLFGVDPQEYLAAPDTKRLLRMKLFRVAIPALTERAMYSLRI